jgi:hypothetical protein
MVRESHWFGTKPSEDSPALNSIKVQRDAGTMQHAFLVGLNWKVEFHTIK